MCVCVYVYVYQPRSKKISLDFQYCIIGVSDRNKHFVILHMMIYSSFNKFYDDVIKWKHFPRYWPFVRGIHRSPVNSPHKGQWRGALMFSLICVWINGWVNNREAGDLRRYRAHYDVTVMSPDCDEWFTLTATEVFATNTVSLSRRLTHWGRDTMAAIMQKTFSNTFSWMHIIVF